MSGPAPSSETGAAVAGGTGWLQTLKHTPRWLRIVLLMLVALVAWFGIIGTIQAGIAPDAALRPTAAQLPPGGSVTVGFAARLLDVEVNERQFTPNDPFFFPTGFTRRTPAYQQRVVTMTATVVRALAPDDRDEPLARAAAALETPPEQWWLHAGWPPIRPSAERAYRRAIADLELYNRDRASAATSDAGTANRIDPMALAAVAAVATALEAEAASIDRIIRGSSSDTAAIQLAAARGAAHAGAMLLRGIRDDQAGGVRLSGKASRWAVAIDALDTLAAMSPLVARESDLVRAGYHLLTASAALREILA